MLISIRILLTAAKFKLKPGTTTLKRNPSKVSWNSPKGKTEEAKQEKSLHTNSFPSQDYSNYFHETGPNTNKIHLSYPRLAVPSRADTAAHSATVRGIEGV